MGARANHQGKSENECLEFRRHQPAAAFQIERRFESLEKAKTAMRAMSKMFLYRSRRRLTEQDRTGAAASRWRFRSCSPTSDFTIFSEQLTPNQLRCRADVTDVMAESFNKKPVSTSTTRRRDQDIGTRRSWSQSTWPGSLRCAVEKLVVLSQSSEWRGLRRLKRFGLHQDSAGRSFRRADRMNYTAIGDAINLHPDRRLEQAMAQRSSQAIASLKTPAHPTFGFWIVDRGRETASR